MCARVCREDVRVSTWMALACSCRMLGFFETAGGDGARGAFSMLLGVPPVSLPR